VDKTKWRLSFTARVTIAYLVAILATTLAAGVPAYSIVSIRLNQQASEQLASGERVANALLQSAAESQSFLARLISQRPTLLRMLSEGDQPGLDAYLRILLDNSELDQLAVLYPTGDFFAGSPRPGKPLTEPSSNEPRVLAPTDDGELPLLVVFQPVDDAESGETLGFVYTGRALDSEFCHELTEISGFEGSILWQSRRIASSLSASTFVISEIASEDPASRNTNYSTPIQIGDQRYLAGYISIPFAADQDLKLEIALPVDDLLRTQKQALLMLIFSTAIVALITSIFAIRYARQITSPLKALTLAAEKIGHGDLSTPVPVPAADDEISTLALALEESRLKTHNVMEELSQAIAWSQTLIQSISEGIVTVNLEGVITSFNQGAERILGYGQEQVVNRPLTEILKIQGDGEVDELLSITAGVQQFTVTTGSGNSTTLSVNSTRFATPDHQSDEIALVLRDVTEQEALQNLRSYFLANISHEFRTPLSALNASVELMLSESDDLGTDEIRRLLSSVHMSVTGLQTLIDNLLESASIEAGKFAIHRQVTDLEQVLQDAGGMLQPLLDRRGQRIEILMQKDSGWIFADPTRITQVLVNLISNASKYGPIDEPIEVRIEAIGEEQIKISVADHGPGLTYSERSTIFRRFVRLRSDQSAQYGMGLGLYVVKAIVEEHGGEVGVEDRPGGGSVFWFTLPGTAGNEYESPRR
jgi:PAS domain S-box-containing protein